MNKVIISQEDIPRANQLECLVSGTNTEGVLAFTMFIKQATTGYIIGNWQTHMAINNILVFSLNTESLLVC